MNLGRLRPGSPVRRMPNVLRQSLADRDTIRMAIGEVVDVPDDHHVTVVIGDTAEDEDTGTSLTVPRLTTYVPTIGEPAYLLISSYFTLALGTVD